MSMLLQHSSRILQVDTSSSLLGAYGIFFRASSKVEINDNQFSNTNKLTHYCVSSSIPIEYQGKFLKQIVIIGFNVKGKCQ
jgi:hypothetical protein